MDFPIGDLKPAEIPETRKRNPEDLDRDFSNLLYPADPELNYTGIFISLRLQ